MSLGGGDGSAFKRRPVMEVIRREVESRANAPDRRDVSAWMRPDIQNLACHSGVQRKPNTFAFLSTPLALPHSSIYLHWLLHDHRSHPASVIIKERPGPPGAPR